MKWLARMPAPIAYALASFLFYVCYYVLRYRRDTVEENLRYAFPSKTQSERRDIARGFYRHFSTLVVEVLRSTAMPQAEFAERVKFPNLEVLESATSSYTKQAIVLLIHQGNWEWVPHAAMAHMPISADPVYKPLHSPFWDAFMLETRSRFGASPIAMAAVSRDVIRKRKASRIIGMLADQSGPKYGGYWTDFLSRPASFHRGAGKLANTLDLPVVFAQCQRSGQGAYTVRFHPISVPPHELDDDAILEHYVRLAEKAISEQPETYLWTNRRWKKTRPDDTPLPTGDTP